MYSLRPYQAVAVDGVRGSYQRGRRAPLLVLSTGGGKCLGKGTPVLMYDGTTKPVEKVTAGDLLMGPDSKPRTVVGIARGQEMMYKVTPTKGDPYIVNESHILSLKITGADDAKTYQAAGKKYKPGEVVNVSVLDYLATSKTFKHVAKGWRASVDFEPKAFPLSLHPYFVGMWLGDGNSRQAMITTGDKEVKDWIIDYAESHGANTRIEWNSENSENVFIIDKHRNGRGGSVFNNALSGYNLIQNKHIPLEYKTASRLERLQLLAGIIDSDGHYDGKQYNVILKNERLLDDVIFVARSLGFSAYKSKRQKTCTNNGKVGTYYSCSINGGIDQIPVLVPRKKANPRRQKKSVLVTGIKVEPIGIDEYFGFELDGPDRLFMLGDFTVTHNTIIFSYIAANAVARGKRVWIIVHRDELLRQAAEKVTTFGITPGIISPKYTPLPTSPLQIAMIQSTGKRLSTYPAPDLIITDEGHHAGARTYQALYQAFPNARHLVVTATPIRMDGKGLGVDHGGIADDLILGPSTEWLMSNHDEGTGLPFLMRPEVYFPNNGGVDLSGLHKRGGDFVRSEAAEKMNKKSITGNAVDHYEHLARYLPGVAFCVTVQHAKDVAQEYKDRGYRAEFIDGATEHAERVRILRGLADGSVNMVTSCDLVSEGFDLPNIVVGQSLRPTDSLGLYLQQIGRILRPLNGKDKAIWLDHVGNVVNHGLPEDEREWTLEGEMKSKRAKEEKEKIPPVTICENCYLAYKPVQRVCPHCGHERRVDAKQLPGKVDGSLEKFDPKKHRVHIAKKREQGMAQTLEELQRIGKERGYSPGWAKHIYDARQKKQPQQEG